MTAHITLLWKSELCEVLRVGWESERENHVKREKEREEWRHELRVRRTKMHKGRMEFVVGRVKKKFVKIILKIKVKILLFIFFIT
jgi:hypothetical protein